MSRRDSSLEKHRRVFFQHYRLQVINHHRRWWRQSQLSWSRPRPIQWHSLRTDIQKIRTWPWTWKWQLQMSHRRPANISQARMVAPSRGSPPSSAHPPFHTTWSINSTRWLQTLTRKLPTSTISSLTTRQSSAIPRTSEWQRWAGTSTTIAEIRRAGTQRTTDTSIKHKWDFKTQRREDMVAQKPSGNATATMQGRNRKIKAFKVSST